jgi:hypothetical protein
MKKYKDVVKGDLQVQIMSNSLRKNDEKDKDREQGTKMELIAVD